MLETVERERGVLSRGDFEAGDDVRTNELLDLTGGRIRRVRIEIKRSFRHGGKSRAEFIVSRTIRRGRETKVVVHDERFGTDGVLGQSAERGVGENLRVADVDDFHDQRDRRGHLGPVGFSG